MQLGRLSGRFSLHAVDQHHINNLEGVVVFFHDHTAAIPREGNEVGVGHFEPAPVCQVQNERLKRVLVKQLADRDGIHAENLEDWGTGVKRGYGSQTDVISFISAITRFSVLLFIVQREAIAKASRIVVKLGTGVLTDSQKRPDLAQMEQLVRQIASEKKNGREIVLVTSGAVGAGMGALGYQKRPGTLAELQACAAVGQSRLMATYEKIFSQFELHVAQVLLTHEDLQHHERHLNARNTLVHLLRHGVIPIINENDAVSFTELKFGDNDKLSALVACLLPADLLIILTTVEGVIENFGEAEGKIIPTITQIDSRLEKIARGTTSSTAVGGMASKVDAAKIVTRAGIPLVIASGRKSNVLAEILTAQNEGTMFVPQSSKLAGRKRWIAFFHHPKGAVFVDEGARKALRESGRSLLAPGLTRWDGEFSTGDVIRICDANGTEFARGIAGVDAAAISKGSATKTEIVHRDNLVIL